MHWGECSGPHRVSSRWSLLAMAASVSPLGQHPLWCTVLDHLLAHLCVYDREDIVIRVLLVWEDQGPLQTIRRQRYRCSLTSRDAAAVNLCHHTVSASMKLPWLQSDLLLGVCGRPPLHWRKHASSPFVAWLSIHLRFWKCFLTNLGPLLVVKRRKTKILEAGLLFSPGPFLCLLYRRRKGNSNLKNICISIFLWLGKAIIILFFPWKTYFISSNFKFLHYYNLKNTDQCRQHLLEMSPKETMWLS